MNTRGHHDIAVRAGLPLLRATVPHDDLASAMLLGNWLTDVSQAVDPVALASAQANAQEGLGTLAERLKKDVDGVLDEYFSLVPNRKLREALRKSIDETRSALLEAIDWIGSEQDDEGKASIEGFFRALFFVVGYFKFVHPRSSADGSRLPYSSYTRLFGRYDPAAPSSSEDRPWLFSKYYPHEHLDRPVEPPPSDPTRYAERLGVGAPPGPRSPRSRRRTTPDLYAYLRDDIEMTAGLLAEVDVEFRRVLKEGASPADRRFEEALAKLGHALHQVEDFFAHSNFVELAIRRLGPSAFKQAVPASLGDVARKRASTKISMRLKRYVPNGPVDWTKLPPEDWVVTGYFDARDSIISLGHLLEETLGMPREDPFEAAAKVGHAMSDQEAALSATKKALLEALELATDPVAAFEDPANELAQGLSKGLRPKLVELTRPRVSEATVERISRRLIVEMPVLAGVPEGVREAFFFALVEGIRLRRLKKSFVKVFSALRNVAEFFADTDEWLKRALPAFLIDQLKDAAIFYSKDRFFDWVGQNRVGSHSLLAKDHGTEPLFSFQQDCATAVHWYVVKTLLRWKEEQPSPDHVDWTELLEFFLDNPLSSFGKERGGRHTLGATTVHVVARGEQLASPDPVRSLERLYRPTAVEPGSFSWRTIADANFGTGGKAEREARELINSALRNRAWGVPVRPPNYAFRPGLRLLIPDQRVVVKAPTASSGARPWFAAVFSSGWRVFPDTLGGGSGPPAFDRHKLVGLDRSQAKAVIHRARQLRRRARRKHLSLAPAKVDL